LLRSSGLALQNAIADRLTLVSPALAPALVALARRHRELSDAAERVLGYIAHADRPTAGQVRAFLGAAKTWPNPADEALAELQRNALIDRGATTTPETGAAYLGKDGIPYRIFDRAHPKIVKASKKLGVAEAARVLVGALPGVPEKKLASMFKRLLSRDEIHVLFTDA